MEIATVRKQLTDVCLQHPKDDDSREIVALRSIAGALLHMAEAIEQLQRQQPSKPDYV